MLLWDHSIHIRTFNGKTAEDIQQVSVSWLRAVFSQASNVFYITKISFQNSK